MTLPHPTLPAAPTLILNDLHVTESIEDTAPLLLLRVNGDPRAVRAQLASALYGDAAHPEQWANHKEGYVPFAATLAGEPVLGAVLPTRLENLDDAQAYLDRLNVPAQALTFAVVSSVDQIEPFTHTLAFPVGASEYGPDTLILPLTASVHKDLRAQMNAAQALAKQYFSVGDPNTPVMISELAGLNAENRAHITGYLPVLTNEELENTGTSSAYSVLHATAASGSVMTLLFTGDISDEQGGSDPYDTFPLNLTLEPAYV